MVNIKPIVQSLLYFLNLINHFKYYVLCFIVFNFFFCIIFFIELFLSSCCILKIIDGSCPNTPCQYLVVPPCARATAFKRLGMLLIRLALTQSVMHLSQVLCNSILYYANDVMLNLFTSRYRIAHAFSMGERSGDWAGHGCIISTPLLSR